MNQRDFNNKMSNQSGVLLKKIPVFWKKKKSPVNLRSTHEKYSRNLQWSTVAHKLESIQNRKQVFPFGSNSHSGCLFNLSTFTHGLRPQSAAPSKKSRFLSEGWEELGVKI